MRWMTERMATSAGMDVPVFPGPGHHQDPACSSFTFDFRTSATLKSNLKFRKRQNNQSKTKGVHGRTTVAVVVIQEEKETNRVDQTTQPPSVHRCRPLLYCTLVRRKLLIDRHELPSSSSL
ncbi:hypothetical protein E3N88_23039 [Mikania micrantha]|uniref:Uncharacterized protein n=1 Tax=Mikania micrantha TaxID=192012 RepID=A0A5N6NEN4_9ASTR|nr:hypothetical protein E3N88_23039 [Mikania micrantha]